MATKELDRVISLINNLSATDRQKLAQYLAGSPPSKQDTTDVLGRASRLLEAAEKMSFSSGETDVSERSREILNTEFGDYLDNDLS